MASFYSRYDSGRKLNDADLLYQVVHLPSLPFIIQQMSSFNWHLRGKVNLKVDAHLFGPVQFSALNFEQIVTLGGFNGLKTMSVLGIDAPSNLNWSPSFTAAKISSPNIDRTLSLRREIVIAEPAPQDSPSKVKIQGVDLFLNCSVYNLSPISICLGDVTFEIAFDENVSAGSTTSFDDKTSPLIGVDAPVIGLVSATQLHLKPGLNIFTLRGALHDPYSFQDSNRNRSPEDVVRSTGIFMSRFMLGSRQLVSIRGFRARNEFTYTGSWGNNRGDPSKLPPPENGVIWIEKSLLSICNEVWIQKNASQGNIEVERVSFVCFVDALISRSLSTFVFCVPCAMSYPSSCFNSCRI